MLLDIAPRIPGIMLTSNGVANGSFAPWAERAHDMVNKHVSILFSSAL
jgi:hypothetical protein